MRNAIRPALQLLDNEVALLLKILEAYEGKEQGKNLRGLEAKKRVRTILCLL